MPLELPAQPHWMTGALCATETGPDDALWFPSQGGRARRARTICSRCPVASACLRYALDQPTAIPGIWGGTTVKQRARLKRARPPTGRDQWQLEPVNGGS